MNTESRTKNSIKNATLSIVFQIISILCSFIVRTVFIHNLSSSYLGISSLFTNILSLLSLADLGFDTAIIFSLYKPIAEKDENQIAALMNYFKKVYIVIGLVVFTIGMILMPFLDVIVNLENDIGNIKLYYFLYLLNTSLTYFLANRVAIINADQRMYVVKKIAFIFSMIQTFFECVVLIFYKNFILFLTVQLLCTLFKNIVGVIVAQKMYPFLNKNKAVLSKEKRKDILNNTRSFMIYKIGGVILNNTDNILISTLILTEIVGIYSNYTTIISSLATLIDLFFSSALASIGNLNVKASVEKKESVLYRLKFMSVWIYGMCSICLITLLNDFIGIMWGTNYVMSIIIPLAAIINFLIIGFLHPFRLYRETTSAFKEIKYVYIATSILNLLFSVILASILPTVELKLFGIIIATAIARLMTNYWLEPKKIINVVLKKSAKSYFMENIKDLLKVFSIGIIIYLIMSNFIVTNWAMMICKALVCFILTNLLFWILNRKDQNFLYLKNMALNLISNFFSKKKAD